MNGLKEDFSKLKGNLIFNEWRRRHGDTIFSYAFNSVEDQRLGKWHFGFYDKTSQKVTSFAVDGDLIENLGEDDVFSEDGQVFEASIDSVKMPILEMFDRIIDFVSRKYPHDTVGKIIMVLQHIPKFGNIWNITLVTKSMNTINLKVDPVTGEVKFHKLMSLFDFKTSK
ncbi:MAG TPA: hypothetical protein VJI46_00025 [Candidatus Nanoarchaeia archaeon]|nr:hypothetical protein [Candidatus Nanoarchaeia archaeon]